MEFTFTVTVQVERTLGKFATRDEIAEQISGALEGADIGTFEGENGGEYEVTDWSVDEQPQMSAAERRAIVQRNLSRTITQLPEPTAYLRANDGR